MAENDTLHLWFKPYGGIMNETDLAFVERYSKRYYPKAMTELAKQVHRLAAKVMHICPPGMFEFQLQHYTRKINNRYVIQESLRDLLDVQGLNFGIQATTPDERRIFADCFTAAQVGAATTQSVPSIIAYLEDSLEMESHKWENAKMQNGQEVLPVLLEIISFLKTVKNAVTVHTFEVDFRESGIVITIVLLSPDVLSYYTRIDWTIV